jgi:hypothetical protein
MGSSLSEPTEANKPCASLLAIRTKPCSLWASQATERAPRNLYDDLCFTDQPYSLVCGFETGLLATDSSSAAFTG